MEIIKAVAQYCDFDNLQNDKFKYCDFKDLKIGDIVKTTTMTYSQKYLIWDGYEECNMVKVGIILHLNSDNPANSTIYKYDFENEEFTESNLYIELGTSGSVYIEKYFK